MTPATRRHNSIAAATRPPRAARAGFTLVEMLVSVTLVLLMMLMFAEIYSLAQNTISTQRGIAENDQKARILSEVLRRDLAARTFRSVYPFKLEASSDFVSASPNADYKSELITKRRGYFSYSENHPDSDVDDVLQLTISIDQIRWGTPGSRIFGRASAFAPETGITTTPEDGPEYDDGLLGNSASASGAAEVSYFVRNGNLYRSVLLIRQPYLNSNPGTPASPTGWQADYVDASGNPLPFWRDFDFSAYRAPVDPTSEVEFHGPGSLDNNPSGRPDEIYVPGTEQYRFPKSLGVPHMRFGHITADSTSPAHAPPLEFTGAEGPRGANFDNVATSVTPRTDFFGRFTASERANTAFAFPGSGFSPFGNATTLTLNANNQISQYVTSDRRGVDLMLPNVHAFDIEVWDDIIGDYVDLGHDRLGTNPYTGAVDEPGFYSASRLRRPLPKASIVAGENYLFDHSSISTDFGNRFDTWHPRMLVSNGDPLLPGTLIWRTGRAPYRPRKGNPDPNTATANLSEQAMPFGNERLDLDLDGLTYLDGDPGETDAEAPLRAIRIKIRYVDPASGQLRQSTVEHSLID